jgi:hypothetical protein
MSFNLVDLVKEQLTETVTGYVGNMLGGDTDKSSSMLDAALPAVLGGLMNTTSNSSGAGTLFNTISKQDEGILGNLGDLLGQEGEGSMMSMGRSALGSVLGGSGLESIVDAVSGFAGADKGSTKSIMGMLAPIIFSVIKNKFMGGGNSGFDVGSLVDMFSGQKDNITAALPKGLDLDFGNNDAYETARNIAPESKSGLGKFLPLALLIGAGWMAYNMFVKDSNTVESTTHTTTQEGNTANMANLGQNITGTMSSLVSTLEGIKDESSANAAVANLTKTTDELGNYASMLDKLPEGAKGQVSKYVMDYVPQLTALLNKVDTIPGVGSIMKPVVAELSAKLAMFQ